MHEEAQKLSDPGRFFDKDRSPGYQKGMIKLFEKVLVPAQYRGQDDMNYNDYNEIHEIPVKYAPNEKKAKMRKNGGISGDGYNFYGLSPMKEEEIQERLTALQEMREERINELPLFQNWQSLKEKFLEEIARKIVQSSDPPAITVGWVRHNYTETNKRCDQYYGAMPGFIIMLPAYLKEEGPKNVNTVLKRYYQDRGEQNQTEYQRLREIARTVRALHIMHPKYDGNGRTHIFGLMNKWLIEEGFCPAILPNGARVFGGIKTLDGLVEDMLVGMHSFIKEVEEDQKRKNRCCIVFKGAAFRD